MAIKPEINAYVNKVGKKLLSGFALMVILYIYLSQIILNNVIPASLKSLVTGHGNKKKG